mgnify:CR=1 FL=1
MGQDLKDLLHQKWGEDWLIGADSHRFWQRLRYWLEYYDAKTSSNAPVLISTPNSLEHLTQLFAAHARGYDAVLGNPAWKAQEQRQLATLQSEFWQATSGRGRFREAGPERPRAGNQSLAAQIAESSHPPDRFNQHDSTGTEPSILIPTGGTSGQVKLVMHTWQTLMASVEGFRSHFKLDLVNAYCVLPLFHVSGLMQALRVFTVGGKLALQSYDELKRRQRLPLPSPGFLSLVPTQLQWLLEQNGDTIDWLQSFRAVLLGGAPPWPRLLHQAREKQIPIALTYGMTETGSQVATLLPEQFLAGKSSNGRPLPHAAIHILNTEHQPRAPGLVGQIAIAARSLALGTVSLAPSGNHTAPGARYNRKDDYLRNFNSGMSGVLNPKALSSGRPQVSTTEPLLLTDDMGFLDDAGELHVVGRRSNKLITGGENVFPEEVETVLLAAAAVQDVCVVGLPDNCWGQCLCGVVVLSSAAAPLADLAAVMQSNLARYKCPKVWIAVEALPRTAQGKINRKQALQQAEKILRSLGSGCFQRLPQGN